MEIFKKEFVIECQQAILDDNYKMQVHPDYSFLHTLYVAGIFTDFIEKPDGGRECMTRILDSTIDAAFVGKWRKEAPGKFPKKDFKSDNRNIAGDTPYIEVSYKSGLCGGQTMHALLREFDEHGLIDLDDEEQNEHIRMYCNIIIDKQPYSVIKFYLEDDLSGLASTKCTGAYISEADVSSDNVAYIEQSGLSSDESIILF